MTHFFARFGRAAGLTLLTMAASSARPAPVDVQPYTMKQLFDAAANPLGWQRIAGLTVGVTGGRFFNIARVPNGNNLWLISIRTNQYSTDVLSCLVSDDTIPVAAAFKPNDPVIVIGKLAGSPHDNRPAFDDRCFVATGDKPKDGSDGATTPSAMTGSATPQITTTVQKFHDDVTSNGMAFDLKYKGKTLRLTGGLVGDVSRDHFELTTMIGGAGFQRQSPVFNCFVNPASAAALGELARGRKVTVIGTVSSADLSKAINAQPILENCTFEGG